MKEQGTPISCSPTKPSSTENQAGNPVVTKEALDLFLLFRLISQFGGFRQCNKDGLLKWREVANRMDIHIHKAHVLRQIYKQFLLPYEEAETEKRRNNNNVKEEPATCARVGRKALLPTPEAPTKIFSKNFPPPGRRNFNNNSDASVSTAVIERKVLLPTPVSPARKTISMDTPNFSVDQPTSSKSGLKTRDPRLQAGAGTNKGIKARLGMKRTDYKPVKERLGWSVAPGKPDQEIKEEHSDIEEEIYYNV